MGGLHENSQSATDVTYSLMLQTSGSWLLAMQFFYDVLVPFQTVLMNTHAQTVQQQVLRLISQIQCEDIRLTRENREFNRQKLTLPVTIKALNDADEIDAVSRDLSSSGMGLVSSVAVEPEALCELEIELENSTHTIFSKCLWCKPFGKGYYLSGWKFECVL